VQGRAVTLQEREKEHPAALCRACSGHSTAFESHLQVLVSRVGSKLTQGQRRRSSHVGSNLRVDAVIFLGRVVNAARLNGTRGPVVAPQVSLAPTRSSEAQRHGSVRMRLRARSAGTRSRSVARRRASARTLLLYRADGSAIGARTGRKVVRARDELRECCGLELPRLDEQREHSAKSRGG
jgi:hypothetical protein